MIRHLKVIDYINTIEVLEIKSNSLKDKDKICSLSSIYIYVRTQFETTHSSVGFAPKKAQTISFIERGFERLGLDHQTVGFSWCSYIVKSRSP